MSFTSQEWHIEALVKEALKDIDYYQAFGGGVTVSGGEPLYQYPFVTEFFKRLHEAGVHTALDTCGLAPKVSLDSVLPHTDQVLFDIKILDPAMHKKYTNQSNGIILENLAYIADFIRKANREKLPDRNHDKRLWIRTPLIPNSTATQENIIAISRFIHDNLLDVIERWEMCAFNSACKSKYKKLGLAWTYEDASLMRQEDVDKLKEAVLSTGLAGEKLVISGLVVR